MTLKALLRLSRPRFWLYEAGTFAVGVAAALARGGGSWDALVLVWFVYFLVPANLLIYGVNDVFDYETDRRNPKKQGYEALLDPKLHRKVLLLATAGTAVFVPLLLLAPASALLPFVVFLLCAVCYSAPPVRAKARPVLDSVVSAGHYVATGWFAYVLAGGSGTPWEVLLAGMCWAMAMHAYSAVPDIRADRESGLATVATWLGARRTLYVCAALYAASAALVAPHIGSVAAAILLLPYLAFIVASLPVAEWETALMARYRLFPYCNALVGAAVWWLVVLGVR